jgi:hypothetical protein
MVKETGKKYQGTTQPHHKRRAQGEKMKEHSSKKAMERKT